MKKFITSLLALVLCFSMTCPVLAAGFVPSIGYKPAPDIVGTPDEDGNVVIGHIVDEEDNILSTEYEECILITPVSETESLKDISEEAADLLLETYGLLEGGEPKLSEVEGLNELVEQALGEGKDGDDLVIKDFFDVMLLCDDYELLTVDGNTIDLTFDAGVKPGTFVAVMVYVDGKWVLVDNVVNNGDGTITGTFEDICPVAILVPEEIDSVPVTGDTNGTQVAVWSAIAIVSLVAVVAVTVVYRRKMAE